MAADCRGSVLVVEDEEIVQELIVHLLEREGYRVLAADNGQQALRLLQGAGVEMVLTDLRMPVMDGLEMLRQARASFPDVDIVVLTGYGTIDGAVEALKLGALDYLPKPFDIAELVERVADGFRRREERLAERRAPIMPLAELARILSSPTDLDAILDEILALIRRAFQADHARLALWGDWAQHSRPAPNKANGEGSLPDLSQEALRTMACSARPWLLSSPSASAPSLGHAITVPIISGDQVIGSLQIGRQPCGASYAEPDAQTLNLFGAQIVLALHHQSARQRLHETLSDRQEFTLSAAEALAEALGAFDRDTREHCRRVSRYARALAEQLGLDAHQQHVVEIAGLLHDIGKLGVGETTLRKNGQLSEAERERVNMHPEQGARILSGLPSLAEIVPIVQRHHERYDGKGYPQGLRGDQIPLGARLLAVVDAFDSMTTDRPYQEACSVRDALRRLLRGAGTQFDPRLARAWCQLIEHQPDGSMLQPVRKGYAQEAAGR